MSSVKKLIFEVLEKGVLMSLGTYDGEVWVSDVLYTYDNTLSLYWRSFDHTRHSEAIVKHPQVSVSITISNNPKEKNIGIQISGTAAIVEKIPESSYEKYQLKKGENSKEFNSSQGTWYKLTPSQIDLIYEPLFGYEKKTIRF